MSRNRRVVTCRACLLAVLSLFLGEAMAMESEKDFAKCQKMLLKNTSWLLEKADKAQRAHDQKIEALVSEVATAQFSAVIDSLIARYEPEEYRRVLIDESIESTLDVTNDEGFRCRHVSAVKTSAKTNLKRYENRLKEIKDAVEERLELEDLGPDDGLVVILFYAQGYAQNISINRLGALGGSIRFGPVNNGDYFRVLKVKSGDYRWHSIWRKTWAGRSTAYLKHSEYDFRVEPGKLNITGAFTYSPAWSGRYSTKLNDRAAVVLSLLEDRYPELLDEFDISNSLDSDNRFVDFYLSEKAASDVGDDGA